MKPKIKPERQLVLSKDTVLPRSLVNHSLYAHSAAGNAYARRERGVEPLGLAPELVAEPFDLLLGEMAWATT